MSQRDDMIRLFKSDNYTRMGLRDVPWSDTLVEWIKQGFPTTKEKYIDYYSGNDCYAKFNIPEYPVDVIDYFDMDLVKCGFYWDVYPIKGMNEIVSEDDETTVTKNGAGALFRYFKKRSACPEHIGFEMTEPEIWYDKYKPHLAKFEPDRINIPVMKQKYDFRRKQGKFIYFSTMFVWETIRSSLGDEACYMSMLTEEEWMHDICRTYTDFYKQYMQYVFDNVGKPDGVLLLEDLAYKGAPFCSPKVFDEIIFPYYRELIDWLHEKGILALLHSCGCVTTLLPYIADCGFDMLNPMEVKAGCDLEAFVKEYKNNFVFMGGMDARILESGDFEAIRKDVIRITEMMKKYGARYIFGSDHSLSTMVSFDSFRCAVDTYREHMYY